MARTEDDNCSDSKTNGTSNDLGEYSHHILLIDSEVYEKKVYALKKDWGMWLRAARPKTLSAAVVPVLVGSAIAHAGGGETQWLIIGGALISSLLIQAGTNLVNDACDFDRGADTSARIGPMRVTQAGIFSSRVVHNTGVMCFLLAVMFCLPAFLLRGRILVGLVLLSCFTGYVYTGGPAPLGYHGLGDVAVIAFFGFVATSCVRFIHGGGQLYSPAIAVASAQIGMLAAELLAINNIRDVYTDAMVGKRTLPVRFGLTFGRIQTTVMPLGAYALGIFWILQGVWLAGALPLLTSPLAAYLIIKIWKTPPCPEYNQFLAKAGILHLLFGIALTVAFMIHDKNIHNPPSTNNE